MLMALLGGNCLRPKSADFSAAALARDNESATPPPRSGPAFVPDPSKTYTLPELVNLAEQNNPDTRVAWENAKARAADLGISKSTLYPTMAAVVLAQTDRYNLLFAPNYIRQTLIHVFSRAGGGLHHLRFRPAAG